MRIGAALTAIVVALWVVGIAWPDHPRNPQEVPIGKAIGTAVSIMLLVAIWVVVLVSRYIARSLSASRRAVDDLANAEDH